MEASSFTWCSLHCWKLPCPTCADRAAIRYLSNPTENELTEEVRSAMLRAFRELR